MNEGFIKLSRKFFANPFWAEKRKFSRCEAWLDLIQMAKIEKTTVIVNGKVIILGRGQVCASIRYLSERWGFTTMHTRTFVSLLKSTNMITTHKHNNETVVTLVKYGDYNDNKQTTSTPNNKQSNNPSTNEQQTSSTKNKNIRIKEYKEEKKDVKILQNFDILQNSHSNKELKILNHTKDIDKKILWSNRKAIFNCEFKNITISGGAVLVEYGGIQIKTKEFSRYLTDWCIETSKSVGIWSLFVIYCDIIEKEYYHIEKTEHSKFEALFAKFEDTFKDTIS